MGIAASKEAKVVFFLASMKFYQEELENLLVSVLKSVQQKGRAVVACFPADLLWGHHDCRRGRDAALVARGCWAVPLSSRRTLGLQLQAGCLVHPRFHSQHLPILGDNGADGRSVDLQDRARRHRVLQPPNFQATRYGAVKTDFFRVVKAGCSASIFFLSQSISHEYMYGCCFYPLSIFKSTPISNEEGMGRK
jgi:hypothetical protein